MDSAELSRRAALLALEKKAKDLIVLYIGGLSPMADYFLICSAANALQARAIADHVEEQLATQGVMVRHREGYDRARWILLDYGGVVIHVFHELERSYYDLERLWGDAPVTMAEEIAQA
ncbi:MAG: ribosome silencing factor [Firmicutes bacterium]|nr:ribosome silencing factor [Bacillota bacterium]MCL5038613.1 ribosome silencing factor [Bacillota bacterium]